MIYRTAAMLSSREGSAVSRGLLKKTEFTPPPCGCGVLYPYTLGNVMLALRSPVVLRRICVPLMGCRCA